MKLKRFLALVVSLSMVLSIVPAFSITASAADYDSLLAYIKSTTAAFDGSGNHSYYDADVNNWSGWSSSTSAYGKVNLRTYTIANASRDSMQFYCDWGNEWQKNGHGSTSTVTSPGYGAGNDLLLIEWYFAADGPANYNTYNLYDTNSNVITSFTLDTNTVTSPFGIVSTNYNDLLYQIFVVNNDDGTHDVLYYRDGTLVTTETSVSGTINGFGSMSCSFGSWNNGWRGQRFADLKIYTSNIPASSDASTISAALNNLTIATMSNGAEITLPATVTDSMGTTVDVTWTSSDTSIVSNSGQVTQTYEVQTATLTPSATFDGATVTGSAKTITVFPKSLAGATTYKAGDSYYNVGTTNLIESFANSNFSGDDWNRGWTVGGDTNPVEEGANFTRVTDNDVTYVKALGNGGSGDARSIQTTFEGIMEVGKKYILAFTTNITNAHNTTWRWVGYADGTKIIDGLGFDGWTAKTAVFTATATDLKFNLSYLDGAGITNFELYEVTDAATVVTLNIKVADGTVAKTLTYNGLTGETASFAEQSFSYNGVFYTTEAVSYTVGAENATYEITATADTTRIATTNNFSYNFAKGEVIWAGDRGFNSADKSGTVSIGWTNFRQTIMTFPIPVLEGEVIGNIDLTVQIGASNTDNPRYNVYAIDPSLVGDGTMDPQITGYADDDLSAGVAALGGILLASQRVTVGSANTITLDLSNAISLTKDGTLALLITSEDLVYTYSSTTEYPPYLSSTYTTISSITYNLKYVDESGNEIGEGLATTVDYVPGTQYGYNEEVICPNLAIPTISGYIFKSKSVSGTTITLTYAVDSQDDYFFNNITDMDTRFVSLNMLGSHDAFTAGVDETRYDAAGVAQGNESAKNAMAFGSLSTSMSITQDLTALGQLQAGARYFDTRLSRSTSDASYLLKTAPHTNGVFYTMHGLLFDEFEPALYSIAQWAATHPGEIIVLDFQEFFDDGDATADSWKDLNTLLTKTGIMEYVTIGNGSIKNVTYGQLTENGKKCGIVLFGRSVATSAGVGKFILRDLNGDLSSNDGRLYSNYETNLDADISSSFSADYVQAQVDWMDDNYPTNEDHPIYWAFRIMQAQSESTNLLNQAASDNTRLLNALNNNPEWLTALPVVMVNRVGTNTDGIVELLKSCNVPTETVNYVYNGTTVYSEVGGLVGTLYTNDGFYDTPIYKLVNDENGEYYVSETFYTTPDKGTITPVVKGSAVEVDVTKLGNVYSARYQPSVSGGMLVYDDSGLEHFSAYDWNDTEEEKINHRIGVAVLEADKDASAYMLKATELRDTTYGQEGTLNFYAVSYEDYLKLDLTKYSSYESVVNSYSPVAYYTTKEGDAYDNAIVTYVLDETGIKNAIGDSGKVVIIGAHTHGLYRLSNDIEIVSGWLVTTDDKQTVVANGGSVDVKPADGAAALTDGEGYILAGESTIESVTKDITLYSVSFGADMVTGAQVRIGDGVDGDGKVTDGSGLRFITTVNPADSLAYEVYANYYDAEANTYADGYDIGVIITAEGSDVSVKVSATKWQDAYATDNAFVYTSALTNLAESNFNRKFKAVPYVTVNGVDVVGDTECERSIYQVAAGLLVNSSTDNTSYDQTALDSEILYKVLNAYVNQTGIRLSLSDTDEDGDKEFTARTTGSGAYSGDVFFTVGETTVSGDVYTVTLTPVGEKTEILDYWNGYVRINNNNGQIYVATTLTYNEADGTYTLEFDASKVKSN